MILEAIIMLFIQLSNMLMMGLPTLTFSIPPEFLSVIDSFFMGMGYIFPLPQLIPIFAFSFAFYSGKIVWAIILRIKSFIPTMGG